MTVREAFEKAGHPVPPGRIAFDSSGHRYDWFGRCDDVGGTRHKQGFKFIGDQWSFLPCEPGYKFESQIDLSNLPAIDAYAALPECVRKVLDEVTP